MVIVLRVFKLVSFYESIGWFVLHNQATNMTSDAIHMKIGSHESKHHSASVF